MKVSVVIPARKGGSRLPDKILKEIGGKPMLWHVWSRVQQLESVCDVVVAVDDNEVKQLVESWGGKALLTLQECSCGTERISSILEELEGDFILNVQADECFIEPKLLNSLVECYKAKRADIITPIYKIKSTSDLEDPNVVKVVLNGEGRAIYFSRSPVPYMRSVPIDDWVDLGDYWWHVGVYGYARKVLEEYCELPKSSLECVERLEQLRFLEAGYCIQTVETEYHSVSVDTQADLEKANQLITGSTC